MVVMVILGLLASIGLPSLRLQILKGNLEEAKPYLMAIASKERIYFTQNGSYYANTDEQNLENTLGVDLKDAANFCFVVRTGTTQGSYISNTANTGAPNTTTESGFEVWAILRDDGGADSAVTVTPSTSPAVTCTSADRKNSTEGWVNSDTGEVGSDGRVVVLRYPATVGGLDTSARNGRTGIFLDWINGITVTDALR